MTRYALISVSDKEGIVDFAKELKILNFDIISTGKTFDVLKTAGIDVLSVKDITGFEECLDGRIKTLHPKIFGGILAKRDDTNHIQTLEILKIQKIDLVVVNLYPFLETIKKENVALEEVIENIDIGGPSMIRAAAKNYKDVICVTNKNQYHDVIKELKLNGDASIETKFKLSSAAFLYTSSYDTIISNYFNKTVSEKLFPESISFTYNKVCDLRYGENPHQIAAFYKEPDCKSFGIHDIEKLHGKDLSYNNINDINTAIELINEFEEPTVIAIKHANPCSVASSSNILDAYMKTYQSDPVSIFGGIVVLNRKVDYEIAERLNNIFIEIVIAPDFSTQSINILTSKKNIRILKYKKINIEKKAYDIKKVLGGLLVQTTDTSQIDESNINIVTNNKPTDKDIEDMIFAMKVVKHTKSNAIVIVKNKQTLGIGPGQTNRITSTKIALENAKEDATGAILASDAFFPFRDCVDEAVKKSIKGIIQPGGSIRDQESIDACNESDIFMVFTGVRHFKH